MQCSWHDSWKAAILGLIQPYTTDVRAFIWSRSKLSFITVLLSSALMKDMKKGITSDFLCAGKVNDCALKNCREGAFVCVCVPALWSVKQRFLIFAGILFENKWWRQEKVFRFDVTSLYRCLLLTPQFKLFRLQQSLIAHPNYQKCLSLGFSFVCVCLCFSLIMWIFYILYLYYCFPALWM